MMSTGVSAPSSTDASKRRHSAATCGVTEYMRALAIMRGPIVARRTGLHNGHVFLWPHPASTIGPVFATAPSLVPHLWPESEAHEETEFPPRRIARRRRAAVPRPSDLGAKERRQDA